MAKPIKLFEELIRMKKERREIAFLYIFDYSTTKTDACGSRKDKKYKFHVVEYCYLYWELSNHNKIWFKKVRIRISKDTKTDTIFKLENVMPTLPQPTTKRFIVTIIPKGYIAQKCKSDIETTKTKLYLLFNDGKHYNPVNDMLNATELDSKSKEILETHKPFFNGYIKFIDRYKQIGKLIENSRKSEEGVINYVTTELVTLDRSLEVIN
jgi:hypothetical protein